MKRTLSVTLILLILFMLLRTSYLTVQEKAIIPEEEPEEDPIPPDP